MNIMNLYLCLQVRHLIKAFMQIDFEGQIRENEPNLIQIRTNSFEVHPFKQFYSLHGTKNRILQKSRKKKNNNNNYNSKISQS